jgi:hypothetical protein
MLLGRLSTRPVLVSQGPREFRVTNPISGENGIPDIFRHFRHSQCIALEFLVVLGSDATVEHVPIIPNRLESAGRKLG